MPNRKFKINESGTIPILVLVAIIGFIAFLAISSTFSFKNSFLSKLFPKSASYAATIADWPMAGANQQRTSWTAAEAPGMLKAAWVKPIEPYISLKTQVIAVNKTVFVSTSKGLYAFDSDTGADIWVYPTELPLGNSPTYDSGAVFVGGLDRKLHAVNATDGSSKWTFSAGGAFQTNPLVVNGIIYAGNDDGSMYALDEATGVLKWKYQISSQIRQSAAYNNGVVYFGGMDTVAYALDSTTGSLKWKSAKMPGMGFRTWWPVVYQDKVIFTRATDDGSEPGAWYDSLFPTHTTDTTNTYTPPGIKGTEPGPWPSGQITMDVKTNPNPPNATTGAVAQSIPDYFEANPKRRVAFVLNQSDGSEVQYDLDNDGKVDAAPIIWSWTHSDSAYPPVVGSDGVIYFRTVTGASGWIPSSFLAGWNIGTSILSLPMSPMPGLSGDWPSDEPLGISAGGRYAYWSYSSDISIGGVDLSQPNANYPALVTQTNTRQFQYNNNLGLPLYGAAGSIFPLPSGYWSQYPQYFWSPYAFINKDVQFYPEGRVPGPAIYDGKVFTIRSNALVAFSSTGAGSTAPLLSVAKTQAPKVSPDSLSVITLQSRLDEQIQKILTTTNPTGGIGPNSYTPLRSGHTNIGIFNQFVMYPGRFADNLNDYWHSPSENILILLRALPHVSASLQQPLKDYIQSIYNKFPPYRFNHTGFVQGKQREPYDYSLLPTGDARTGVDLLSFYALWKYAQVFGSPKTIFDTAKNYSGFLNNIPSDIDPVEKQNGYIAGLTGYLKLQQLAGYPVDATKSANLDHLLSLRAQNLKWDISYSDPNTTDPTLKFANNYYTVLQTAWNFLYMVPELADYLNQNALTKAQDTINKYQFIAPYWPIGENYEVSMEDGFTPYQQTHELFQAKGLILKQSQEELTKYLDSPLTPVGDMYYIDNLVTAIEASNTAPPPGTKTGDINGDNSVNIVDLSILLSKWNSSDASSDINKDGKVSIIDLSILLSNWGK